jgi:hypothetical protein
MSLFRRVAANAFVFLAFCVLSCAQSLAGDNIHDESAWREYRAAKRQQVSDLCDIWFATYRPNSVGKTYVELASRYDSIDLSKCSPALRKHIKRAERDCTEIGELFGQGGSLPDISDLLTALKPGGSYAGSVNSLRGMRILELMGLLSDSERAVSDELKLDE